MSNKLNLKATQIQNTNKRIGIYETLFSAFPRTTTWLISTPHSYSSSHASWYALLDIVQRKATKLKRGSNKKPSQMDVAPWCHKWIGLDGMDGIRCGEVQSMKLTRLASRSLDLLTSFLRGKCFCVGCMAIYVIQIQIQIQIQTQIQTQFQIQIPTIFLWWRECVWCMNLNAGARIWCEKRASGGNSSRHNLGTSPRPTLQIYVGNQIWENLSWKSYLGNPIWKSWKSILEIAGLHCNSILEIQFWEIMDESIKCAHFQNILNKGWGLIDT